ncbi:hypothetical protein F5148DRAFT_1313175 [Russula earlei]|uniref:Uncharacterized protein n=1 Tax=Russula earlei TaxID=71964 RepID=A0ACC0U4R4_9AGAM|nr:hypothetical protein F5148DRAFT_1313175 [Russula earlei]
MQHISPSRTSTKPHRERERETAPVPTDIAEKMIALKRKQAKYVPHPPSPPPLVILPLTPSYSSDRAERPVMSGPQNPPSPTRRALPPSAQSPPSMLIIKPEPDPSEFSRLLRLSPTQKPPLHTPAPKHQGKLFNPDTDPIPMRRIPEPEAESESAGSSYAPRPPADPSRHHRDASQHRQLFDPRKHDPVTFSAAQARKPVPKSSVSSSSSYTHSVVSSSFTLNSSTTDGSSAPSSIFDHKPRDESKTNAFSNQLRKLYRDISLLEAKVLADSGEPQDESRIVIKGCASTGSEEAEKVRWKKAIEDHKLLSEMMLNLLEVSLAPGVPASLRNIPDKYNIVIRLWTNCFYRLLENLRRSSLNSKIALEYLQEFIYYAYTFYTALLERKTFSDYRSGWLEALGDLARYRIVIAAMIPAHTRSSSSLTAAALHSGLRAEPVGSTISLSHTMSTSNSEKHPARPDSPTPSVGIVAARMMELEPEKDRWRRIARDWYAQVVAETPGRGKLHHHLGLLSREAEGEELRGVYHFVKSMIATHPFETARESVLPLWSQPAQARRSAPDARAPELFVLLHGMLFTNIQLDDFSSTLARLLERLRIEEPEGRDWAMMAAINIAALLEYGRPQGILRRTGALGPLDRNAAAVVAASKVKLARKTQTDERMEVDVEERRRSSDLEAPHVGPSIIQVSPVLSDAAVSQEPPFAFKMAQELTFSMLAPALRSTRDGPNAYVTILVTFLQTVLRHPEGLATLERSIPWTDLAAFLSRGPVVSSNYTQNEKLGKNSILQEDWAIRGMAWSGKIFGLGFWDGNDAGRHWHWRRTHWASSKIAKIVPGFMWDGKSTWKVDGVLAEKVRQWEEEDRLAREEEERRKMGRRWVDVDGDQLMDIEDEIADNLSESGSEDDEDDPQEIKALKARRRYLRSLQQLSPLSASTVIHRGRPSRPSHNIRKAAVRAQLQLVPGYTILVLDTNILLSSLPMVASLPATVRSHAESLKVQTSRGNYLSSLSVRAEQAAIWQDEHWVDRSALLKVEQAGEQAKGTAKVVLLSLDRNLRLKARARHLDAASERDLGALLAAAT